MSKQTRDLKLTKPESSINADEVLNTLTAIFNSYDENNNSVLDKTEFKNFLDDVRVSLNLTKCDNKIIKKIFSIVDSDKGGDISLDELLENIEDVLPIICECDYEMEQFIKKIFKDFDVNNDDQIEKNAFRLMLDIQCSKMGVQRCDEWQIDYIFNQLDIDSNGTIDLEELLLQYGIINSQLSKNQKLEISDGNEAFNDFQMIFQPMNDINLNLRGLTSDAVKYLRLKKYRLLKSQGIPLGHYEESYIKNMENYSIAQSRMAEIKKTFMLYDSDENGILDKTESRHFINDLRLSLSLTKSDNSIFERIFTILDTNKDGHVSYEEFVENLDKIVPILCECGEKLEIAIRRIFSSFDIDNSGFWEKNELVAFLNILCDNLQQRRCSFEMIDTIIDSLDKDQNGKLDIEEFIYQYSIIGSVVFENKKLNEVKKAAPEIKPEDNTKNIKSGVLDGLIPYAINIIRKKKKGELHKGNGRKSEIKLDRINEFGAQNAKDIIPISGLINFRGKTDSLSMNNENEIEKAEAMHNKSPRKSIGHINAYYKEIRMKKHFEANFTPMSTHDKGNFSTYLQPHQVVPKVVVAKANSHTDQNDAHPNMPRTKSQKKIYLEKNDVSYRNSLAHLEQNANDRISDNKSDINGNKASRKKRATLPHQPFQDLGRTKASKCLTSGPATFKNFVGIEEQNKNFYAQSMHNHHQTMGAIQTLGAFLPKLKTSENHLNDAEKHIIKQHNFVEFHKPIKTDLSNTLQVGPLHKKTPCTSQNNLENDKSNVSVSNFAKYSESKSPRRNNWKSNKKKVMEATNSFMEVNVNNKQQIENYYENIDVNDLEFLIVEAKKLKDHYENAVNKQLHFLNQTHEYLTQQLPKNDLMIDMIKFQDNEVQNVGQCQNLGNDYDIGKNRLQDDQNRLSQKQPSPRNMRKVMIHEKNLWEAKNEGLPQKGTNFSNNDQSRTPQNLPNTLPLNITNQGNMSEMIKRGSFTQFITKSANPSMEKLPQVSQGHETPKRDLLEMIQWNANKTPSKRKISVISNVTGTMKPLNNYVTQESSKHSINLNRLQTNETPDNTPKNNMTSSKSLYHIEKRNLNQHPISVQTIPINDVLKKAQE